MSDSARCRRPRGGKRDSAFPRRDFLARVLLFGVPPQAEGAGNAGRWPHPQALWAEKERCPQVSTGRPNGPALPAQWLYGLLRALPGVSGFLVTVAVQIAPHNLTPASRGQATRLDRTRLRRTSCGASTSIASRTTFRDDREAPPLVSAGRAELNHVLRISEIEIFLRARLDMRFW
jgi:hypothetical protein